MNYGPVFVIALIFAYWVTVMGYWQVGSFAIGAVTIMYVSDKIIELIQWMKS